SSAGMTSDREMTRGSDTVRVYLDRDRNEARSGPNGAPLGPRRPRPRHAKLRVMTRREHFVVPETPFPSYEAYLRARGAGAVEKARALTPNAILDELGRAGLRGRGGAGFPTGAKWRSVAQHPC